jgi:predicted MFS family arabinose efflux permease
VVSPLGALARYRSLPRLASGSWMALALAARAPYAMIPLGALTAFTASTGSVATGGLATGLVSVAGAVAGPLIGRAADRGGRRRVLGLLAPLNAIALTLLLVAALAGWDGPGMWLVCLAAGATAIPVGSFARVHWVEITKDPRDLSTALSYESTVDELTFVLGPALVGIAAGAVLPAAPLALAAVLVAGAGIPFARRARTLTGEIPAIGAVPAEGPFSEHPVEPDPRPRPVAAPSIPSVLWAVLPAIIVMVCIGAFFGSVQAGTTERAALAGAEGAAGLVYAVMGLGSAVTALLVVLLPQSVPLAARVLVGGLGMAALMASTAAVTALPATALLLAAVGLFIGPTMVTAFALTDRLAPPGGTGVAMTSMQSSVTVGQAGGAMLGGALAAATGPAGAFAVSIAAGVVIVLVGLQALLRRPGPASSGNNHGRDVDPGGARSS